MGASRTVLLALSESPWLRARAPHWPFVKRAAARFMPGEDLDSALDAARALRGSERIDAVLTRLGENVTDAAQADAVRDHYLDVLARIAASGARCELSVKLTQLGLDIDPERCYANVHALAERAQRHGAYVWIDMEQHAYLERTLAIFRRVVAEFPDAGVCLQAYLYRTRDDLQSLLPLGGGVRLVKGAYREPATVAFPKKSDVDANYLALAGRMLQARSGRTVFGTHDAQMIGAIAQSAERSRASRDAFEFHLLYGIQRALQSRLARNGYRVRVLISYGDEWFAWYMRRLAERPANVLFAVRALLGG